MKPLDLDTESIRLIGLLQGLQLLVDADSHHGPYGEAIGALAAKSLELAQEISLAIAETKIR
jgi:hypothetical protein